MQPSQAELCDKFSLSRNTVRSALKLLETEGLVRTQQGAGAYVLPAARQNASSNTIAFMCAFSYFGIPEIQEIALRNKTLICFYFQEENKWNPRNERVFLEQVKESKHKALIAFCSAFEPYNTDLLQDIAASGTRVIHVENYNMDLPREEYILADHRKAGYMAGVAFLLAGYDECFFVGLPTDGPVAQLLEAGYKEALAEGGVEYDREKHFLHDWEYQDSEGAIAIMLRKKLAEGRRMGFLARSLHRNQAMRSAMHAWGFSLPEQAGFIEYGFIGEPLFGSQNADRTMDTLELNSHDLVRRAILTAIEGSPSLVSELVSPVWSRKGTVLRHRAGPNN